MLRWFVGQFLRRYEQRYDYDAAYLRAMFRHAPEAFWKFAKIGDAAQHRFQAPGAALFAAKLVGTVGEDCGPCTQLVVNQAREAGVGENDIAAVLERKVEAMGADAALGFRFADAVLAHGDDDAAREAVRAAWGERGVVELSRRRVRVGARDVDVAHAA
jgi:hypothetical protein